MTDPIADALTAALLYHQQARWTQEDTAEWRRITGSDLIGAEALRKVLRRAQAEHAAAVRAPV